MSVATVLGPIGALADHATTYAAAGLEVFPVNPRDKTPLVSQHQATTDPAQIGEWWTRWPTALIGHRIAAGQLILDIDPRHGGLDTWRALRAEIGQLPATRGHASGRGDGGGHTWWLRPADKLNVRRLNQWAKEHGVGHDLGAGRWTAGIDLLHRDHRYTILPPSPHPDSGRPYTWIDGHGLHIPGAPLPQLLVDLLVDDTPPAPAAPPRAADPDSIADWYSNTYTWHDLLARHGWTLVGGDGHSDGARWRHPTASAAFSATIRHNCLFVYSTSTAFETTDEGRPHGYTLFRAYAVLDHDGDLKAAGRAARELKGDKPTRDNLDWAGATSTNGNTPHSENDPGDDQPEPEREATSWRPIDLTDALAGIDIPPPELWHRSDDVPLIYRARVHWFQGESESCKSWAAQIVVVDQLNHGHDVLYIDYEDDDRGVVARLLALGTAPEEIAAHLIYIRPDEALRDHQRRFTDAWLDLAEVVEGRTYSLCVIDGVTEAMTTEGLELISNTDIAGWMRLLPKMLANTGAAVVCIDHVTKNSETQGRYAIGGQHKLAGVTGAVYRFTALRPLARATSTDPVVGTVAVTVMKDRPGYVRGRSPEGKVGTLSITAYPDGGVTAVLDPHGAGGVVADLEYASRILTYLATYNGSSKNKIEHEVEGKTDRVREALTWMIDKGWVRVEQKGQSHLHWLTEEGRSEVPAT